MWQIQVKEEQEEPLPILTHTVITTQSSPRPETSTNTRVTRQEQRDCVKEKQIGRDTMAQHSMHASVATVKEMTGGKGSDLLYQAEQTSSFIHDPEAPLAAGGKADHLQLDCQCHKHRLTSRYHTQPDKHVCLFIVSLVFVSCWLFANCRHRL
jgi:hypothetical protein